MTKGRSRSIHDKWPPNLFINAISTYYRIAPKTDVAICISRLPLNAHKILVVSIHMPQKYEPLKLSYFLKLQNLNNQI